MIVFELIRRLFGYVLFSAGGGFAERFLNCAAKERIKIWDVKRKNGVIYAKTYINSYKRIRNSARRSGMSVKIEKRIGFPFFARRYRHRVGLVFGFVVFLVLTVYFSSIVWVVEVKGNERISSEKVVSVLSSLGVRPGVFKSDIIPDDLQYAATKEIEGIEWIAVNINGAVATIELREDTAAPEIVERDKPCNIVAEIDGEIISISALLGDKCVSVGDGVTKGQLLISGVSEDANGTVFYRHAMGSVVAKTGREFIVEIPMRRQEISYVGEEKTRYAVDVLGVKLNLYFDSFDENWIKDRSETRLTVNEKTFPLALYSERFRQYVIYETVLTPAEALELAKEEMSALLEEKGEEMQIEEIEYVMGYDENVFTYVAKCTCIEEIAVKKEIIFQENP
ncbi:MAG: sporulation protein YqfD [Clostridia bacterium]|nr:sporulation protein YqfD [Clostridia bacterium]